MEKMGIAKINTIIESKCPKAKQQCSFEEFRGCKIAIDAALKINKVAYFCHTHALSKLKLPTDQIVRSDYITEIKHDILNFAFNFMKRGITPVFIFDGAKRVSKTNCVEKRKDGKLSTHEKSVEAMKEYDRLATDDPYALIDGSYEKKVRNARKFDFYVSTAEMLEIMEMFLFIGIPAFRAIHDGEKLCASLAIEGLVDAVLTSDTDCFPLGTPNTIVEHDFATDKITVIVLSEIVDSFKEIFNCETEDDAFTVFVDLCIMCGCDFNSNIPNIAINKAFKLLEKYKSIEEVGKEKDIECLNHNECREIFSYEDSKLSNIDMIVDFNLFDENLDELVSSFGSFPLTNSSRLIDKVSIKNKKI